MILLIMDSGIGGRLGMPPRLAARTAQVAASDRIELLLLCPSSTSKCSRRHVLCIPGLGWGLATGAPQCQWGKLGTADVSHDLMIRMMCHARAYQVLSTAVTRVTVTVLASDGAPVAWMA